jgi:hypothetical protein
VTSIQYFNLSLAFPGAEIVPRKPSLDFLNFYHLFARQAE